MMVVFSPGNVDACLIICAKVSGCLSFDGVDIHCRAVILAPAHGRHGFGQTAVGFLLGGGGHQHHLFERFLLFLLFVVVENMIAQHRAFHQCLENRLCIDQKVGSRRRGNGQGGQPGLDPETDRLAGNTSERLCVDLLSVSKPEKKRSNNLGAVRLKQGQRSLPFCR